MHSRVNVEAGEVISTELTMTAENWVLSEQYQEYFSYLEERAPLQLDVMSLSCSQRTEVLQAFGPRMQDKGFL